MGGGYLVGLNSQKKTDLDPFTIPQNKVLFNEFRKRFEFTQVTLDTVATWTLTQVNGTATCTVDSNNGKCLKLDLAGAAAGDKADLTTTNLSVSKVAGKTIRLDFYLKGAALHANSRVHFGLSDSANSSCIEFLLFNNAGVNKTWTFLKDSGVGTTNNVITGEVFGTYKKYSLIINAAWTSVQFLVNDVVVATETTNIEDNVAMPICIHVNHDGAAAAGSLFVQYAEVFYY